MEKVNVQGMALDPLAAVQQPAQGSQGSADGGTARRLDCMHRTHLVGNGADSTDTRCYVGCFGVGAPAEQRLEESRRLEDLEGNILDLAVFHPDVERALALHTS